MPSGKKYGNFLLANLGLWAGKIIYWKGITVGEFCWFVGFSIIHPREDSNPNQHSKRRTSEKSNSQTSKAVNKVSGWTECTLRNRTTRNDSMDPSSGLGQCLLSICKVWGSSPVLERSSIVSCEWKEAARGGSRPCEERKVKMGTLQSFVSNLTLDITSKLLYKTCSERQRDTGKNVKVSL